MWKTIIGLQPDQTKPGWEHFYVQPIPGGGIHWAKASYHSMRGPITIHWRLNGENFEIDVSLPPNTEATLKLPGRENKTCQLSPGKHHITAHYQTPVSR
jgi:alpha-L-rhamnosidase